MSGAPSDECLVCSELSGHLALPGGLLIEDALVTAFHVPPMTASTVYAGHVLVVPRRHTPGFGELTSAEAAAVGIAVAVLTRRLQDLGADRVYVATIGHDVDHLHVHLLPRWPGTPADVAWHSVDEWPGARRVDADGIAAMSLALRD